MIKFLFDLWPIRPWVVKCGIQLTLKFQRSFLASNGRNFSKFHSNRTAVLFPGLSSLQTKSARWSLMRKCIVKKAHSVHIPLISPSLWKLIEKLCKLSKLRENWWTSRVRPLNEKEISRGDESISHFPGGGQIWLEALSPKEKPKSFTYNVVFEPEAGQEDVLAHSGVKRLIDMAIDGFSCTVFCYGQTGSGKTHTLTGPPHLVTIFYHSLLNIIKLWS